MPHHRLLETAKRRLHGVRDLMRGEIARRRELRRFRAAGRAMAAARGEVDHLVALQAACAGSHEADRADSAAVDAWMMPLVAVRGVVTRAVLHHQIARGHRALRGRYEALGRAEHSDGLPLADAAPVPAKFGAATLEPRAEAVRFGRAFWAQLRPAVLPRAPALAGLAVGWWIANTYTDSRWKSLARSLGIGSGGTHVVSGETYRAMSFWLPLLAAAVCAYLGDRIAAAWREGGER